MKKQITLQDGSIKKVDNVQDILLLNLKISEMVAIYNTLTGAALSKFTDKKTGAARLLKVLPKYEAKPIEAPKPEKTSSAAHDNSVKSILRRLFTKPGAAYSLTELQKLTSAPYKVLMDDIARLKNPKYCGKHGTLTIAKNGGTGLYINAIASSDTKAAAK